MQETIAPGPNAGTDGMSTQQPMTTAPAADARLHGQRPAQQAYPVVNGIPQMHPLELKRRLDAGEDIFLLDVREPHEHAMANLGGQLVPLGSLPHRIHELDPEQNIVVHCKMGGRSQYAAEMLARAGFKNLFNLAGGIYGWANSVGLSVRK